MAEQTRQLLEFTWSGRKRADLDKRPLPCQQLSKKHGHFLSIYYIDQYNAYNINDIDNLSLNQEGKDASISMRNRKRK